MARSKETFGKKELEKKKAQKRKEKEARREARKAEGKQSFDDMIAYTDEFGNILDSPPDPAKRQEVDESEIVIGARNSGEFGDTDPTRRGKVTFFNQEKGFGFIEDNKTGDRVFVHMNVLEEPLREGAKVSFETEKGPKGLNAVNVEVLIK